MVEPELKPRFYKHIAGIAPYLTGIYADHASAFVGKPRSQDWRVVPDYEREGRRFYTLAARGIEPPGRASVLEKLAEKFTLAREALNMMSDRYLKPIRARYFDQPDGCRVFAVQVRGRISIPLILGFSTLGVKVMFNVPLVTSTSTL